MKIEFRLYKFQIETLIQELTKKLETLNNNDLKDFQYIDFTLWENQEMGEDNITIKGE